MSQPRTKLSFSDRELKLLWRSVRTKAGAVRLSVERAKEKGNDNWLPYGRADLSDLKRLATRLEAVLPESRTSTSNEVES